MTLLGELVLATQTPPHEGISLELAAERMRQYVEQSRSVNTKKAYSSDWRDFESWCMRADRESLPATAETLGLYLAMLAEGSRVSTITRRLSSIAVVHRLSGHESSP